MGHKGATNGEPGLVVEMTTPLTHFRLDRTAIKETKRDVPSLVRLMESMAELLDNIGHLPLLYQSELTASRHSVRKEPPSRSTGPCPVMSFI